jgi:hypothetical protein
VGLVDADLRADVGVVAHVDTLVEFGQRVLLGDVGAGGDATLLCPLVPDAGDNLAGVEAVDGRDAFRLEPLGDIVGQVPRDHATRMDAVGLEAFLSDAVVADQRIREREDLLLV